MPNQDQHGGTSIAGKNFSNATHYDNDSYLIYRPLGGNTCSVTGLTRPFSGDLEIPYSSPLGDVVVAIEGGAFEGARGISSIRLPSGVKHIGDSAFKGCRDLVSFFVDRENPYFCASGGVLHSKDKTTLICYPQSRTGKVYLLDTNVKYISENAFFRVKNLESVNYEGNTGEFEKIIIGNGNDDFLRIPITCNYIASK